MFQELGNGVFRRRYDSLDLNVGVVVSEVGVLVVDTRASHVEAGELLDDLRSLTALPVRWVVDTHWHWDHTFGNSRFGEAEIWGHELCRKRLIEHGVSMRQDASDWFPDRRDEFEEVLITPPGMVFGDTARIDLGSIVVALSYHGLGHTDADIVVSVGDVRFMGDLLEEGAPPVFDDGYPLSWPSTLESALEPSASVFVPGHGDVMSPTAARVQLEEIEEVARLARACVEQGSPVAEVARLGPYPEEVMTSALERALLVRR